MAGRTGQVPEDARHGSRPTTESDSAPSVSRDVVRTLPVEATHDPMTPRACSPTDQATGARQSPRCAGCRPGTSARACRCPWLAAAGRRFLPMRSSAHRGRIGRRRWRAESADARVASSALCAARAGAAPGSGLLTDKGEATARPGRAFRHSGERGGAVLGHARGRACRPNGGGRGVPPDGTDGTAPVRHVSSDHSFLPLGGAASGRSALGGTACGPSDFGESASGPSALRRHLIW